MFLDAGIPASEIDSRVDNFVRNYVRFVGKFKMNSCRYGRMNLNRCLIIDICNKLLDTIVLYI